MKHMHLFLYHVVQESFCVFKSSREYVFFCILQQQVWYICLCSFPSNSLIAFLLSPLPCLYPEIPFKSGSYSMFTWAVKGQRSICPHEHCLASCTCNLKLVFKSFPQILTQSLPNSFQWSKVKVVVIETALGGRGIQLQGYNSSSVLHQRVFTWTSFWLSLFLLVCTSCLVPCGTATAF